MCFHSEIPARLSNIKSLRIVRLGSNTISHLPYEFRSFADHPLQELNLSGIIDSPKLRPQYVFPPLFVCFERSFLHLYFSRFKRKFPEDRLQYVIIHNLTIMLPKIQEFYLIIFMDYKDTNPLCM